MKYKGIIYGIPTNKELCVPTGLIVNKTAAALIGWDPDKDPVKTTEELEPWLAKYKEKDRHGRQRSRHEDGQE